MKKSLIEELERIHSLTYGKKIISEEGFLDTLAKRLKSFSDSNKVDDPKKADFVDNDVTKFFTDLKSINEPVSQQRLGSMEYQKNVELIQIGLILLGYDLPKHGVDGLFGPETAIAVRNFKRDNNILSEGSSPYTGGGNIRLSSNVKNGVNNDIDTTLQNKIESIASEYGKSFEITSGYRDPEYNERVHGAKQSQHLQRKAVDIVLSNKTKEDTLRFVEIASKNGIGGIGVYSPGVIHIDVRPNKVAWGSDHSSGSIPGWARQTLNAHMASKIDSGYVSDYDPSMDSSSSSGGTNETFTPEMVVTMVNQLESKGVTNEDLKTLIDLKKKVGTLAGVAATDFAKMNNIIIDKLEGGYYHPKMLKDGRVKDGRYGGSGETMFGMDRKTGEWESRSEEGRQFFKILDNADASSKWPWGYMGGEYETKLRELSAEMTKREYLTNTKNYLNSDTQQIVNSSAKLTFNFIYATYNGPGWFQRFAKVINGAVSEGITDPEELNRLFLERRKGSPNSLIAQGGRKMDSFMDTSIA
jgi:hypothetical protein